MLFRSLGFIFCLPLAAKSEDAIKVDASNLYDEYKDNEVAADAKYKGKVVEVSGEIDHISSSFGKSSVTLGGMLGATCYFSKSEEGVLASLSKGQVITVRGTVDGKLMGVNLKNCHVTSPGNTAQSQNAASGSATQASSANGRIEITSEDLDNAYDGNAVKADATYKGKTIIVKGTVTKIAKDLFGKPYVELHGRSDFLGVQCYVASSAQSKLGDLAVGAEVRLKGRVKGKSMIVELDSCEFVLGSGNTEIGRAHV